MKILRNVNKKIFTDGHWIDCSEKDFDENGGCSLNKKINYRSVRIHNGTCVEMDYENETLTATGDIEDLGHSFNGGYARKCETYNVSLICPNGTFAKRLEWDTKSDLTKGIKMSCYSPEFYNSNATVLESHPGSNFDESGRRTCPTIFGITFMVDDTKDSIVELDLKKNCTVGYKHGVESSCIPETVLTGLDVEIETKSKLNAVYLKMIAFYCSNENSTKALSNYL